MDPSARRVGVAVFYCEVEHFSIKELFLHGLNVISFQLVTGRRQWHVVGCYIAPRYALAIEEVAEDFRA